MVQSVKKLFVADAEIEGDTSSVPYAAVNGIDAYCPSVVEADSEVIVADIESADPKYLQRYVSSAANSVATELHLLAADHLGYTKTTTYLNLCNATALLPRSHWQRCLSQMKSYKLRYTVSVRGFDIEQSPIDAPSDADSRVQLPPPVVMEVELGALPEDSVFQTGSAKNQRLRLPKIKASPSAAPLALDKMSLQAVVRAMKERVSSNATSAIEQVANSLHKSLSMDLICVTQIVSELKKVQSNRSASAEESVVAVKEVGEDAQEHSPRVATFEEFQHWLGSMAPGASAQCGVVVLRDIYNGLTHAVSSSPTSTVTISRVTENMLVEILNALTGASENR